MVAFDIFIPQKVEMTHASTDRWIDKQFVVYRYYEIFFSLKKEENSEPCCNMDEPCRHEQILYDST